MTEYIVAFKRKSNGPGACVVTWSSFNSKEDFDAVFRTDAYSDEDILEQGITQKRAIELVRKTPPEARFDAALENSRGMGPEVMAMELANAAFANRS